MYDDQKYNLDYVSKDTFLYLYKEYCKLRGELENYKEGCKCIDKQISLKT